MVKNPQDLKQYSEEELREERKKLNQVFPTLRFVHLKNIVTKAIHEINDEIYSRTMVRKGGFEFLKGNAEAGEYEL